MSKYWSDFVQRLEPYVPGEQPKILDLIKLNTNENPYPPSPRVLDILTQDAVDLLRLYPDPNSSALKAAVAEVSGVSADNVFVGNGSDEVLALAFMTFFKQGEPLLFPDISYSFYKVYCNLFDISSELLPLADDFSIDLKDYQRPNGGVIFPNPNAPTGIGLPLVEIEKLLQASADSVVIIDEAYIDFAGQDCDQGSSENVCQSAVELVERYPNLLVVQTLSKSRSLAGIRVGFAIGDKALIAGLDRVKNSFNSYPIDRMAEAAAIASLQDDEYFRQRRDQVIATREWTTQQLQALSFDVLPSQANFVFAKPTTVSAEELFTRLREHKILVRYFQQPRINEYLRITVGTQEEMEALIVALKTLVS